MVSPAHHRLIRLSIAFILPIIVGVFVNQSLHADEQIALPPLVNTQALDRVLSEEIGDDYIFVDDESDQQSNNPKPESSPSEENPVEKTKDTDPKTNESKTTAVPSGDEQQTNDSNNSAQPGGEKSNNTDNAADPAQEAQELTAPTQIKEALTPEQVDNNQPADSNDSTTSEELEENPNARQGQSNQNTTNLTKQSPTIPFAKKDITDSVWHRIIQSNRIPLADNKRIQFYSDQYERESMWISKILHRGSLFLSHLVTSLDQRFLPVELALLPAIESGYLPYAKSSGSAVGLWQIVPITAEEIGIQRDAWFDGRGDILTSTTAAIDYLSFLSAEFNGDWELTLAAYNAGPGRVRRAVRKNKKKDLPTDYWSLDLPPETQNYVPKMVALIKMIKSENYGGLDMPALLMEPAFESIDIGFRVSIDKAAEIAGINEDTLRSLNAGLIHGVTPPNGPHYLLIPANTGEQFQEAFASVDRNSVYSEPMTHDVVAGDTISSIAKKYGMSQQRLLQMNGLDSSRIRIGQKLKAINTNQVPESSIEYEVAIGDTLYDIARTFSVKIEDISYANGKVITDDIIHPGDTLNIIVKDDKSG